MSECELRGIVIGNDQIAAGSATEDGADRQCIVGQISYTPGRSSVGGDTQAIGSPCLGRIFRCDDSAGESIEHGERTHRQTIDEIVPIPCRSRIDRAKHECISTGVPCRKNGGGGGIGQIDDSPCLAGVGTHDLPGRSAIARTPDRIGTDGDILPCHYDIVPAIGRRNQSRH